METKKAIIYLEDGTMFEGRASVFFGESEGEVVFNTSMTGYQEILTDPSYAGQIVVMTYPLIGNYGVNMDDVESDQVHVKGFVVKELSRICSNFSSSMSLRDYLRKNNILTIENIDTRALTRHIRVQGAMKAILSTEDFDRQSLQRKVDAVPSMEGSDWVQVVTTKKKYVWQQGKERRYKVAAIDCGIKFNILRILTELGCEVHVFPAQAKGEDIRAINPDGIFISNGPGDPAAVSYVVELVKEFWGKFLYFGICLGHQILGLALGGKTYKLKFGHHGANHPVQDLITNTISITSQNHGFCVDMDSLPKDQVGVTHVNLNDQTVEGLQHKNFPLFCVQYHPESAPGPHDARYLFQRFIDMMEREKSYASS